MKGNEYIRNRRIQLGLTLEEVARRVGVTKATVQRWESGLIENMKRDKIALLSNALNTTPAFLLGIENQKDMKNRIPILGFIPAGTPIEAIEDILDYEEIDPSLLNGGKEYFALKIKGDSMSPKYLDEDVVIFLKQDYCENNDDCAVYVNGYDATFKKIRKLENGITLQPININYEPSFYTNEQIENLPVRIIGKAFEIRRKI